MRQLNEAIIKSKSRVQKHGEVFTPKKIVNNILDIPDIKNACENLTITFIEPAAGEGAFLVEVLSRKLDMVANEYNDNIVQYENYSLFALTTLYGIELLEDNAQNCTMNMFQIFYDKYREQLAFHSNKKVKKNVIDSAKVIIASNIAQGNFLTQRTPSDEQIVFSEWAPINLRKTTKNIRVIRTEYTLEEIQNNVFKNPGEVINCSTTLREEQLSLFDTITDDYQPPSKANLRYIPTKIVEVFQEEMEEENEK